MEALLRNSRAEQYLCAAKKNFIVDNKISESSSKLVICHFSDMHGDKERFESIMGFLNRYKPDFAVHTGDLVKWDARDEYDFFFEAVEKSDIPMYNCIGNHDVLCGEETLPNAVSHNKFIAPLKKITTTGKCWYYTDFEEKRVRLIVLNDYENENALRTDRNYEYMQEQCVWLISALKSAAERELGVIIASHEAPEDVPAGSDSHGFCQRFSPYPWGTPKDKCHVVADIVNVFKNGGRLKKKYAVKSGTFEIDCEFQNASEFICYMNGHRHGDFAGFLPSYPDQLSMGMTCSGCLPPDYHNIGEEISDLPRIPGTVSEDAVNFYVIDREKGTLTVVRFGACINDLLEERQAAVFKYVEK